MFNSPSKKSRIKVCEIVECVPTAIKSSSAKSNSNSFFCMEFMFCQLSDSLVAILHLLVTWTSQVPRPCCHQALSNDFHTNVTKVNSFSYGLSSKLAQTVVSGNEEHGSLKKSIPRSYHLGWYGFSRPIVFWNCPREAQEQFQYQSHSSVCKWSHIPVQNPKLQNILS